MADVTIRVTPNGPYLVTGPVEVRDAEGAVRRPERATIALCRCGGSSDAPFCDGTHARICRRGAADAGG